MKIWAKVVVGTLTVGLTFSVVMATSFCFARAADQITAGAVKGRPVTAKELDSMYKDRTWLWADGAAYFSLRDRAFIAWVGKDAKAAYADGSWSVSDQGRLCFRATWYSVDGHQESTTCFEHQTDDRNIYQRKLPDGSWYVFSHLPALPGDAIQKLQPGDSVSAGYRANEQYLAEHKGRIAADAAKGRALTAKELDAIYADRTWSWNGGAAYFQSSNHTYLAWVGKEATASYGDGHWSVNARGRLCVHAIWHSSKGRGPATTCFEHRADDKSIYQRELPNGMWHVFSHLPAQPGDGIQKLQPGDHVSEDYEANKRYLAEHAHH